MSTGDGMARTLAVSMAGNNPIRSSLSVQTTPTLIPLGGISTPHYSAFYNTDPTNYVVLHNGSSGAHFVLLNPGEFAVLPLDPGSTPYATANTAPVVLEYMVCPL